MEKGVDVEGEEIPGNSAGIPTKWPSLFFSFPTVSQTSVKVMPELWLRPSTLIITVFNSNETETAKNWINLSMSIISLPGHFTLTSNGIGLL